VKADAQPQAPRQQEGSAKKAPATIAMAAERAPAVSPGTCANPNQQRRDAEGSRGAERTLDQPENDGPRQQLLEHADKHHLRESRADFGARIFMPSS
jgi:hypothetical protein